MGIDFFRIIGAIGLISIIIGTFMISIKKRIRRRYIYPFLLIGGICLMIYSYYIQDTIFIILQILYTVTVLYDIIKLYINLKK